jgi:glycine/sarcosine N-methyltransferase
MLNNQEFFDELSVQYDSMIPFEKAIERKKKLFKNLLSENEKVIADIGCGSGSDSIALAELGCEVTSFDPSAGMLKKANENAKRKSLELKFHQFGAAQIPNEFNNRFDVIISLGNSFANIPAEEFEDSISKCYSLLKGNGRLFIQILNYEKILEKKKRIVNITNNNENYFVRFYDFKENEVMFNILSFEKENPQHHQLISTMIFPYSVEDFSKALKRAGFGKIEFYDSFDLSSYNPQESSNLVISAIK